ncbi:MAG TPA: hypothetical protein VI979_03915 [archaeon]|nr:hypothetical protein [archaeon]
MVWVKKYNASIAGAQTTTKKAIAKLCIEGKYRNTIVKIVRSSLLMMMAFIE